MPTFTARLNRSMLLHHTNVRLCLYARRCGRMWNGVGVWVGVYMHISVCLNMIKHHIHNLKRKPLFTIGSIPRCPSLSSLPVTHTHSVHRCHFFTNSTFLSLCLTGIPSKPRVCLPGNHTYAHTLSYTCTDTHIYTIYTINRWQTFAKHSFMLPQCIVFLFKYSLGEGVFWEQMNQLLLPTRPGSSQPVGPRLWNHFKQVLHLSLSLSFLYFYSPTFKKRKVTH